MISWMLQCFLNVKVASRRFYLFPGGNGMVAATVMLEQVTEEMAVAGDDVKFRGRIFGCSYG